MDGSARDLSGICERCRCGDQTALASNRKMDHGCDHQRWPFAGPWRVEAGTAPSLLGTRPQSPEGGQEVPAAPSGGQGSRREGKV